MYKYLAAALAATLTQPATAVTFPTLTTIYVGSGVVDNGGGLDSGYATTFHCTNVSGLSATLRFQVLFPNGPQAGSFTTTAPHGATITASTHRTLVYSDINEISPGTQIFQGGVNIESTQSAVFCTAISLNAAVNVPNGVNLHLVRVNPHPGTVE